MTDQLFEKIHESIRYLRTITDFQPEFGIILGTGLGNLRADIDPVAEISYQDIPHFPIPTVKSHQGKLVLGYLSGKRVVVMAGRFHYYEGHDMKTVTFPVRVIKFLGAQFLIISNAAGGTNPNFKAGDLVFVNDHINLQGDNPLRGPNDDRIGPRFPDMLKTYPKKLNKHLVVFAKRHGINAHLGVYVGLAGPNLETPAEYQFLHRIGGDMVGMSTVPEVLVAKHMDMSILVVSVITNQCYPIEEIQEVTVSEVIQMAEQCAPKLKLVVLEAMNQFELMAE